MSKIRTAFENGKAFIPFLTCGDPDLETTAKIVRAAADNGADLIELGIPFSDPTAEGPVMQGANIRALAGGVTADKIFDLVRKLRRDVKIPFVFVTYANVVFSYGSDRFMEKCGDVGVDGIVILDLPYEEKGEFSAPAKKYGIEMISLIAPTSADRVGMISKDAEGFVYVASSLGAAGDNNGISGEIGSITEVIRSNSDIPCAIGFGISTPEQASEMGKLSDGVAAGSAIISIIEKYGREAASYVGEYVRTMKAAANGLA